MGGKDIRTTTPKEKMSDRVPWPARAQDSGLLHNWLPQSASLKYFPGERMTASSRSEIWIFVTVKVSPVFS